MVNNEAMMNSALRTSENENSIMQPNYANNINQTQNMSSMRDTQFSMDLTKDISNRRVSNNYLIPPPTGRVNESSDINS